MANESWQAADYPREQLEVNLQASEAGRGAVTSIKASRKEGVPATNAQHDYDVTVPDASLRVALDPTGEATLPDGTEVCRGTAWIEDVQTKVALFRTA